ncbi:PrsW family intramembrane metalloprotease [Agromyces protaetiae]|uniref:PrsW family intramembrane metalloprotease n=1 Tax=Agromyces protaetiae TaxID=2509455 RepID=A0A4P6FII4_9MICO|nr:PrsW family intramembrane metalloprotease [Agromyces protaetiae]QAY74379.1 PrsW family intramembrane metalloprotease [Agromyces protaetiae]
MTYLSAPPQNPYPALRPVPLPPAKPRSGGAIGAIVGICIAGVVGLVVIAYLVFVLGAPSTLVATVLALIPLTLVLLAVRWVDRWEPEPRWALWFAFLWGAAVSIAIALLVDLGVQIAAAVLHPESGTDEVIQAVVQAPIVEEFAKGVGVLLIYAFARSHFDGPVDGLVYAATVAAGFAFTENAQYFGIALLEGGAEHLGMVFVMRGIFSPFAHVIFTACTGIALGLGARRGAGASIILWFFAGLVPAILLHALWNGSLAFGDTAILLYFVVQVPIFAGVIGLTVYFRRQEAKLTRARLGEYAAAGWLTPGEVDALATSAGRRQAIRWARSTHPPRVAEVKALIADATTLAFNRQMIVARRGDVRRVQDERELLDRVSRRRAALLTRV